MAVAWLFWEEGFLLNNHPDILFFSSKMHYVMDEKHEWLDEKGNAK